MAKRPSSWVNLQDYLGLNQDMADEMAGRVSENVGDQAAKTQKRISNDQRTFQAGVDTGTVQGPNEHAFDRNANMYSQGEATGNASKSYSGPNSLDDVDGGLSSSVADAVQRVNDAQDSSKSGQVIRDTYGAQAATGVGGSAFDSFLMGNTSSSALSGLGDKYGKLQEMLGLADADAMKRAQAGKAASTKAASRWGDLAPVLKSRDLELAKNKLIGDRAIADREMEAAISRAHDANQLRSRNSRTGHSNELGAVDARTEYIYQGGSAADWDAAHPNDQQNVGDNQRGVSDPWEERYKRAVERQKRIPYRPLTGDGLNFDEDADKQLKEEP